MDKISNMEESEYLPKPIEISFDNCKNEKDLYNYLKEIMKQSFKDLIIFGECKLYFNETKVNRTSRSY